MTQTTLLARKLHNYATNLFDKLFVKTSDSQAEAKILRRPIQARDTRWAAGVARALAKSGLRPNQISVLSMLFGAGAAVCLFYAGRVESPVLRLALFGGAAAGIQLRLLCNLFDGMVAIEGGFKTKSGEIYNELPDRFSDVVILVAAGYSLPSGTWSHELGWTAALLSVLTAYVRAFGGAAGVSQYFCGPMAKQQRMAVITLACFPAAVFAWMGRAVPVMDWALGIVILGCIVTIIRRTLLIKGALASK